ncbi:MAG: hypothetical protein CMM07_18285 [Rhodopirellula sp.]|nr:hypothetical protein [Rhodopirellula sp.]
MSSCATNFPSTRGACSHPHEEISVAWLNTMTTLKKSGFQQQRDLLPATRATGLGWFYLKMPICDAFLLTSDDDVTSW